MATFDLITRFHRIPEILPLRGSFTAVIVVLGVILASAIYQYWISEPDLSHIPILGAELSYAERREAFTKDAKSFLKRGYDEVYHPCIF